MQCEAQCTKLEKLRSGGPLIPAKDKAAVEKVSLPYRSLPRLLCCTLTKDCDNWPYTGMAKT